MVAVSGIIFDATGRLLLQRHRHWVQDVWGLPGGIVKHGETLEEAFAREVFEETRLRIVNIELIKVASNYRLRLEVYFCAALAPDSHASDIHIQKQEILEARFFALNELPANLLPIQKDLIERTASVKL